MLIVSAYLPCSLALIVPLSLKSPICVPFVLVTGSGELQQRENGFALSSKDHGEPHRSGLEPREHVRGYIKNSAADAYNPPPQEQ